MSTPQPHLFIGDLDRADVLYELYRNAKATGIGQFDEIQRLARGAPLRAEFEAVIKTCTEIDVHSGAQSCYVDYLWGRPIKVDLAHPILDPTLYDRDAGFGAAARAVEAARGRKVISTDTISQSVRSDLRPDAGNFAASPVVFADLPFEANKSQSKVRIEGRGVYPKYESVQEAENRRQLAAVLRDFPFYWTNPPPEGEVAKIEEHWATSLAERERERAGVNPPGGDVEKVAQHWESGLEEREWERGGVNFPDQPYDPGLGKAGIEAQRRAQYLRDVSSVGDTSIKDPPYRPLKAVHQPRESMPQPFDLRPPEPPFRTIQATDLVREPQPLQARTLDFAINSAAEGIDHLTRSVAASNQLLMSTQNTTPDPDDKGEDE